MPAISIMGWVIASGMAIINLIIGYLVIPTKTTVTKLKQDFHVCQLRSGKEIGIMQADIKLFTEASNRHEGDIHEITQRLNEVSLKLTEVETTGKSTFNIVSGLSVKMDKLISVYNE